MAGPPDPVAVEFVPVAGWPAGTLASLLNESYAELLRTDARWAHERAEWEAYDREAFAAPASVGAAAFLTTVDGTLAGFGSWDPRQRPSVGLIGHNCVRPAFRGRGIGTHQTREMLKRLRAGGIATARVTTADHPFFEASRRMYLRCGFQLRGRRPWPPAPQVTLLEFELRLD
jgi:RimJ/RimL family protein N-acetyltransferase